MEYEHLYRYALSLLAKKEYSVQALTAKMAQRCADPDTVDAVSRQLRQRGLVSDSRYAELRVHARQSRYGNKRLSQELLHQGLDEASVTEALAHSEDEYQRASQVYLKKYRGAAIVDQADKLKRLRFLAYRGFDFALCRRILDER